MENLPFSPQHPGALLLALERGPGSPDFLVLDFSSGLVLEMNLLFFFNFFKEAFLELHPLVH